MARDVLSRVKGRCHYGSYRRWHAKSKTCRTPCKKSHGSGYRRSPKSPYGCVRKGSKKKGSKRTSRNAAASKITIALRKYSKKRAAEKKKAAKIQKALKQLQI